MKKTVSFVYDIGGQGMDLAVHLFLPMETLYRG